jgi:hypothetical protein
VILETLHLLPRGADGWSSGPYRFGRCTTLLLGPNGAGKTPLMKAIAFCLGQPVELPPKILEKCETAVLTMVDADGRHAIRRTLSPEVRIEIVGPNGDMKQFDDERSFSAWVLPRLGVPLRTLTTQSGDHVAPYMSVVGPMFLVDQDTGWTMPYVPHERQHFVRDQAQEVLRWVLGLPARHRAIDRSAQRAATISLVAVQDQIAAKRLTLEALHVELGLDALPDSSGRLIARRTELEESLRRTYSALESVSRMDSEFDARVRDASASRDIVHVEVDALLRRVAQVVRVQREVGVELGALEENEVAATAFRHFCGNENCQFFRRPEESYGRRVLYLKDQLKDFESGASQLERELSLQTDRLAESNSNLKTALETKVASLSQTQGSAAVDDVRGLSRELAEVERRIALVARAMNERSALDTLVASEATAADVAEELKPSRAPKRDNSRLLDARSILAQKFGEWLLTLRTPNVSSEALLDDELRLFMGGERLYQQSSHSGSTRTRIVLAFHAAVLETSLATHGSHPRLLVLDAPRQHELSAADLKSFVDRFYSRFSTEESLVQLVLSASDADVVAADQADSIWVPTIDFGGGPRFFGAPATPRGSAISAAESGG